MRHWLIPVLAAGLFATACSKKGADQTETIAASSYAPVSTDAAQGGPAAGPAGPGLAPPETQTVQDMLARADERFERLDLDHDGKLSPDEIDRARSQFQARRQAQGGPPTAAPGGRGLGGPGGGIMRADKDGDGVVTKSEFETQVRERFVRLDIDKNGVVSRQEMETAFQAMRQARDSDSPPPAGGR